jgi:hypothetical protein
MKGERVMKKDITYQDLLNLFEKTDEKINKLAEAQKKLDELSERTDERINKLTEKFEKTDKKLNKIGKMVGGITKNLGKTAEELFYNSFSKTMSLGNIKFHLIQRNLFNHTKEIQDECDLVLTNENSKVIVEVKHRFHPNDVKKVAKKIKNFQKLFPEYHNYKIFGAVAALSMPLETIVLAKKYHYFVLTQDGNDLKILYRPDNKAEHLEE